MHATVNRNKRSLSLDLRRPEGVRLFLALAKRSDVVIENFRPGTLARWGAGYEAVRAVRPDVVYVSISGFGQWGPWSERCGYDPLAQAASGFMSLNGNPDGEPVKSPTFLADDLAGLHAALAALAALRHRDATGEGQHVDVALLDAMLFQTTGYLTLGALGVALPRMGNEFRIAAPANTYHCRDGRILIGVLLDTQWARLATLLGRPELASAPGYATIPERLGNRAAVNGLTAAWARELTRRGGARGAGRRRRARRQGADLRRGRPRARRAGARHAPDARRRRDPDHRPGRQALAHAAARAQRRAGARRAQRRDPRRAGRLRRGAAPPARAARACSVNRAGSLHARCGSASRACRARPSARGRAARSSSSFGGSTRCSRQTSRTVLPVSAHCFAIRAAAS